jgi:prepilin-type processing-associated H-X9-DG protein
MFFLFYTKFDPATYLKNGGTKSGGFAENRNAFDKYIFRPLDWKNENFDGKTLYVGSPSEMPHGNNAHITFLDGKPAIEIKDRMD